VIKNSLQHSAPLQIKCLALLVGGLLSGAAFAQTSVVIGGKVDVGYQFARTTAADSAAGGANGGGTNETMTDGSATSSRVTFVAKEDLGRGLSAEVNMDLRFSGGYEQGKTGLTTSDKRVLILRSPIINALWGVGNLGGQWYFGVTEKPYMIAPKDLEIVKWGVSQLRESSLTSRNTTLYTNPISIGPVTTLFHTTYAIGDGRASGTSNVSGASAGDVRAAGVELKVGNMFSMGSDYNQRQSTSNAAARNGMIFTHTFVNVKPLTGLKLAASFNTYRGYNPVEGGAFQEKNTNFVAAYNWNSKLELGLALSHLNDLGANRNSGKAWMAGASYFLTKNTFVYVARSKTSFERNQGTISGGKYDGTATGFIGNISKSDAALTRVGIVKEF
jgi:predicted porin